MNYRETLARYHVACERAGLTYAQAETLRRSAMTLHRWAEHECNGIVDRIENPDRVDHRGRPMPVGKVYAVYNINGPGPLRYSPTADRETPALARAQAIASAIGATLEYQGDPRGWPLALTMRDGVTVSPPIRY